MKRKLFAFVSAIICSQAMATDIFDGYETYYTSLNDGLFKATKQKTVVPYSKAPNQNMKFSWHGPINGKSRSIDIDNGSILIDGVKLKLRAAKAFKGESTDKSDLGLGTEVYFSQDYTCLENVPASASGSAVRHTSVYVINTRLKPTLFVKLPSLFASCLGVRRDNQGSITFDQVSYQYEGNEDRPNGVIFTEYVYKKLNFLQTGHRITATFVEQENVYRFSVRKTDIQEK
jgi:hypothetical protein